jgi:hypothetical protein
MSSGVSEFTRAVERICAHFVTQRKFSILIDVVVPYLLTKFCRENSHVSIGRFASFYVDNYYKALFSKIMSSDVVVSHVFAHLRKFATAASTA